MPKPIDQKQAKETEQSIKAQSFQEKENYWQQKQEYYWQQKQEYYQDRYLYSDRL